MEATMTRRMRKVGKPQDHERIVNDDARTFTDGDWPVGSSAHQGDLVLVRIPAMPDDAVPRKNRQLADGDTQGSRHVLVAGEAFDCNPRSVARAIYKACPKAELIESKYIGPVFRTIGDLAEIDHPEHGNHVYQGEMTVAVVYQKNLDALQREQRVVD